MIFRLSDRSRRVPVAQAFKLPCAPLLQVLNRTRGATVTESTGKKACLVCHRDVNETPLIQLAYRESALWICPQHLPVLIHHPDQLIGTLPGAEGLKPADHHD
jgi:hypothetical protein